VGEVDIIITTETTEVGDNSLSGLNLVIVKCPTFPLGEREGHLEMNSWEVTWFEGGWTFYTVEIVVETRGTSNEEGSRDTNEVEVLLEVVFERSFGEEESFFQLEFVGEDWFVSSIEAVLRRETTKRIVAVECAGHG
jgi:hypothetical protein